MCGLCREHSREYSRYYSYTKELNLNACDSSDHVCLLLLSLAILCLGARVKRPWRMDQREAGMWPCEGGLGEGSGTL